MSEALSLLALIETQYTDLCMNVCYSVCAGCVCVGVYIS